MASFLTLYIYCFWLQHCIDIHLLMLAIHGLQSLPPSPKRAERKREFHNKVPHDKMPLLCRKFCVINKPLTENIVYFCL